MHGSDERTGFAIEAIRPLLRPGETVGGCAYVFQDVSWVWRLLPGLVFPLLGWLLFRRLQIRHYVAVASSHRLFLVRIASKGSRACQGVDAIDLATLGSIETKGGMVRSFVLKLRTGARFRFYAPGMSRWNDLQNRWISEVVPWMRRGLEAQAFAALPPSGAEVGRPRWDVGSRVTISFLALPFALLNMIPLLFGSMNANSVMVSVVLVGICVAISVPGFARMAQMTRW